MLECGMKLRCEAEGKIGLVQAAACKFRVAVDLDPQGSEHIGAAGSAGNRAIAVLDDWNARCRDNESGCGADIEGAGAIPSRSAGIEYIVARGVPANHVLAQDLCSPGNFACRFPFDA